MITFLKERIRHFKHAHLLSMQTDRRYFSKHGQHFNKIGKERLAKDLAFTINEVFSNTTKNSEQIYPLSWKEEGMPQDKLVGPLAKQQCNIYIWIRMDTFPHSVVLTTEKMFPIQVVKQCANRMKYRKR